MSFFALINGTQYLKKMHMRPHSHQTKTSLQSFCFYNAASTPLFFIASNSTQCGKIHSRLMMHVKKLSLTVGKPPPTS